MANEVKIDEDQFDVRGSYSRRRRAVGRLASQLEGIGSFTAETIDAVKAVERAAIDHAHD